MDLKRIAKDTAKTLVSYLTYQATRTVIAQVRETDPPRAIRLQQFSARESIQDGEAYLDALFREDQHAALRILIVREHIAEEIADYLPEMIRTGVQQANMEQRRRQLERMTQLDLADSSDHLEPQPNLESDSQPERQSEQQASSDQKQQPKSDNT